MRIVYFCRVFSIFRGLIVRIMKTRIAIDLVPIRVGEGGTGSGIWTYARELLVAMDKTDLSGLDILVLVNNGQVPYLSEVKNLKLVVFPEKGKNILKRLWWVHVHLPFFCLFKRVNVLHKLATETPWFCSAKRVTTIHDFYYEYLVEHHPKEQIRFYERMENIYFSFVTKLCFRKSKRLIAVSNSTKGEVNLRYSDCADRVKVVCHGSPICDFSVSDDVSSDLFNILCVAKFMEHKGQHLLIRSYERLLECHPELDGVVSLSLRGFHNDEDYFAQIVEQVGASSAGQSICLIPFDPKQSTAEIYSNTDLVVLLSSYEGFGLPVLEAQSMGIPVLCSDLPVLKEVGGDGAVYADREDEEVVAKALYKFVSDSKYRLEMKQLASENVGRFSWEKAAEKTVEAYGEVCL